MTENYKEDEKIKYIVIRFTDPEYPVNILSFDNLKEATLQWDKMQENWSECYLCKVLNGHEELDKIYKEN